MEKLSLLEGALDGWERGAGGPEKIGTTSHLRIFSILLLSNNRFWTRPDCMHAVGKRKCGKRDVRGKKTQLAFCANKLKWQTVNADRP